MRWHDALHIRDLIIRLTETPSISGTDQEREMSDAIVHVLEADDYFKNNPAFLEKHPLPDDKLSREVITALVKSKKQSTKTVVLLSHYDVVGVDGFGRFRPFAFQPEVFTAQLRDEHMDGIGEDVRSDLASGQWLFGRGTMDMKAGLAMQMAMLQHFSQMDDFEGNLLLLATPDEETNSEGMFEAVAVLNRLKEQHHLEYQLCICSEANWSAYPGDHSKYIYTGSVGKLLPIILCVGTETHVGEPLLGVNAAWMAAEMVNRMELSTDFIDQIDNEMSPPPTCLDLRILKDAYNVQTPSLAYAMFNILTLKQSVQEVLDKLKNIANQSAAAISARLVERYRQPNGELRAEQKLSRMRPKVFLYSELYKRGVELFGESFIDDINDSIRQLEVAAADPRDATVRLAQRISSYFMGEAPFYLILLAPPYYPHVYLDDAKEDRKLQLIVEKVLMDALEEDDAVKVQRFFPGLSDVSYCRIRDADRLVDTLAPNMPVLDHLYRLPIANIAKLDLPTINIGPYGKDAHQWTERLELSYSTEVAPQLLANAIHYTLSSDHGYRVQ